MKLESRPNQIHSIQYLRAVAASLVVLHHTFWQYEHFGTRPIDDIFRRLGEIGAGGVDIFFVISGFIIFYTMKPETGPRYALSFMADRFFRVVPIYWIWTTVLIAIAMSGVAASSLQPDAVSILTSYALIPHDRGQGSAHPLLDQGWTLSYEMYFYVIAAVTCALLPMRARYLALAIAIGAVAASALVLPLPAAIRDWLASPLMVEFIAGAGIAALMRNGLLARIPSVVGIGLLSAGALLFASSLLYPDAEAIRLASWGIPAALLVLGALIVDHRPENAVERGLLQLGAASYSIYLTHSFLAMAFGTILKKGFLSGLPALPVIFAVWVIITLASATTYWLLEKPLLATIRHLRSPRPTPYLAKTTSS